MNSLPDLLAEHALESMDETVENLVYRVFDAPGGRELACGFFPPLSARPSFSNYRGTVGRLFVDLWEDELSAWAVDPHVFDVPALAVTANRLRAALFYTGLKHLIPRLDRAGVPQ